MWRTPTWSEGESSLPGLVLYSSVSGEETTSLADVAVTSIARLSSGFGVLALGEISQQIEREREREGESSLPGLVLYSSVSGEETTSLADVAVTSIARLSSGFGVRADVAVTSIARLSSGFGVRALEEISQQIDR